MRDGRHARWAGWDDRVPTPALKPLGLLLAGVLLAGLGVATASASGQAPGHAAAAGAQVERIDVGPSPLPLRAARPRAVPRRRTTPPRSTPSTTASPARQPAAAPLVRWLPTGTGMWLHDYATTEGGDPRAIVARAEAMGLTTLFVQTGSSTKGWVGTPALRSLLPQTVGTGLHVVAWDFPTLEDPVADARRLARAAQSQCAGPRISAVAPDVETAAEGTSTGDAAVAAYYTELRRDLPPDLAILATVPWPSEKRVGRYPYARTAAFADAFLPMTYWYNRSPALVTATSMTFLGQYGKPVMPVGQAFDGRIDAPYVRLDAHPELSVHAFLVTAQRFGAPAVSMWSWTTSTAPAWQVLGAASAQFGAG